MKGERTVRVPGGQLFAKADGHGPPIVLLHAAIVDSRAWDPLVPLLNGAGYRTIRYDARGFGRSETEDVEFSNRADLVAVLDSFSVGRAALVGNSRGGSIAFDTAVEHPERAVAVVLLGAGITGYESEASPAEVRLMAEQEKVESSGDQEAIVDFDMRLWVVGHGQPEERLEPGLRAWLREMVAAADDPSRIRGRPIPLQPPAAERLDGMRVPVLTIAGGFDVGHMAATGRYLIERGLPARLVEVPNVAHLIAVEAPERTAELIVDTLRPLGRWS